MLVVTAAILLREDRVLLTRRCKHDTMAGYWEFPGGGVEPDETPDQGMARELREELAIEATPQRLYDAAASADGRLAVLFYLCAFTGEPQPLVCDEMRWVKLSDLPGYQLLPLDGPVAQRLAAGDGL